jgi:hypothetical protein
MAKKTKTARSTSGVDAKLKRSYTLVSDSAEGIRVPYNRESAKKFALSIARRGSSDLTALG